MLAVCTWYLHDDDAIVVLAVSPAMAVLTAAWHLQPAITDCDHCGFYQMRHSCNYACPLPLPYPPPNIGTVAPRRTTSAG
jgi:hypothetical protein